MNETVLGVLVCVLLISAFQVAGESYIIGGRPAQPGQFPWIVSLRNVRNQNVCGGSILSSRWIATAAHCIHRYVRNPNNIFAVSGAHSRSDGDRNRIARIIIHPRYNRRYMTFDVSVIQIAADIVFNARVQPVAFPASPVVHEGTTVLFAGWGLVQFPGTPGHGVPPVLQWRNSRTISREQCKKRHRQRARFIHAETICTSNLVRKGNCYGDAGGPLIRLDPGSPRVGVILGIASWIVPCARGFPDVYAKFWTAIPFLRAATQNSIPNLPGGPR